MSILNTKNFINAAIVCLVALLFSIFSENSDSFLTMLPELMGLVLAGILSSLAIIFGLFGKDELKEIQKRSIEMKKDLFLNFMEHAKLDVKIIFLSFLLSIIILLFRYSTIYKKIISLFNFNIFFYLGLTMLFLSLWSVYDVIQSVFTLNELRNEIAKNQFNEKSNK